MNSKRNSILQINSIIGGIACLFETAFFAAYVGSLFWTIVSFVSSLVFGFVFLLNKKEHHVLAKYLYFFFTVFIILFYGLFIGEGSGVYFYYIPLVCSLFVSYKVSEQKRIVFFFLACILLSSILLFVFEGRFDIMDFPKFNQRAIYMFNFLLTLMVTVFSVYQMGIINAKIEMKLAKSMANLQAVFDSSAEAKFLMAKDFKIIDFNKAAYNEVFIAAGKQLSMGDNALDYVSAKTKELYIANFNKCLQGEIVEWSSEVKSPDGISFFYEVKMHPVYNENNEVVGVSSRGTNITQKKIAEIDAEHRIQMFYSIFNEVPDALILVDPSTRQNIKCNVSAVKLFEVESEEELLHIKGTEFHKNPPSKESIELMSQKINEAGFFEQELEYVTKKGKVFWGNLVIKKIEMMGAVYSLVRITDITDKVKERENILAFLELQKRDLDNKQKQKNLALIIHGQEQERQRFSKELHDGIGQVLTAVRLQVSALETQDEVQFNYLKKKINNTIDSTISEVKRISSNLMPSAIEDFGLLGALEHLCHLVPSTMAVDFKYDVKDSQFKLSKNEQFAIYRIAQEAINNAVKHSSATVLKVCFELQSEHELLLKIEDNGKGFKQDKIISFYENHTISSGLNNMKERAELINAKLLINSNLGEGTKLNLVIPLH
jgi:PAS domain S-box-containing protein